MHISCHNFLCQCRCRTLNKQEFSALGKAMISEIGLTVFACGRCCFELKNHFAMTVFLICYCCKYNLRSTFVKIWTMQNKITCDFYNIGPTVVLTYKEQEP